jgi:FkbM family methyltransferase
MNNDFLITQRDMLANNSIFQKILYISYSLGLYEKLKKYYNLKQNKYISANPTKTTIDSRKYFNKNNGRINKIISFLSDDLSKSHFLKMIDFRCNPINDNHPLSRKYANRESIKYMYNNTYFLSDIFQFSNSEIFIDCGAFVGDSIKNLIKIYSKNKKNIDKIIAFEPDFENYKRLVRRYKNVEAFNCGVWHENAKLYFQSGNLHWSKLINQTVASDGKVITVPVMAIDETPICKDATFIKMDIEGAELSALIGAEKLIVKNKPKLAISIYHSDEDMLQIAEWIHEKVPEYKIYIRQHLPYAAQETVLYATI